MSEKYEAAIRRLFGVDDTWTNTGIEISGGEQVQIGDYTWDTEPHTFEVWASRGEGGIETKSRTFHDFAELLNALLDA